MARPRLNRNGLWAKTFGKNRRKVAKVEKNCKIFGKIFQKIAENSKKIAEIFQKNSEKPPKIFQNPILLPMNLRATIKVFLRA